MYPKSFNTYDSLGEAYMAQRNHDAAIKNYRQSLALNPNNTNAVKMLKKLGAAPSETSVEPLNKAMRRRRN
jgi:cytochrome c-type biogenesis protein CcmH/NrfG